MIPALTLFHTAFTFTQPSQPAESSRADNDVRVEKRTRLADLVCDEEATELGSWPPWKLKSRFVEASAAGAPRAGAGAWAAPLP